MRTNPLSPTFTASVKIYVQLIHEYVFLSISFNCDFSDTGDQGTESGAAGARSAPVQFEADPAEADPFGLDAFLKDAKNSKKK